MAEPEDFDLPDDPDGDGEFDDFDCGMGSDGQCSQAGTEYCELDCPMGYGL